MPPPDDVDGPITARADERILGRSCKVPARRGAGHGTDRSADPSVDPGIGHGAAYAVDAKSAAVFRETSMEISGTTRSMADMDFPEPLAHLLVVDDEPNIRELLSVSLRFSGFAVSAAAAGREALVAAESQAPDLVILDVMLPDMDGFDVAARLRESRRVPVLFLTAKDAVEDKVAGLAIGDDYVTKPFSLEEVVARIHNVLRRSHGGDTLPGQYRVADLELDDQAHEVRRGSRRIDLSPTEFKVLRYLMANSGRVQSKGQILDHVWNYDFAGQQGIVESYISFLRQKLEAEGPRLLHTVRGVGYILREPRVGE
jgi:two-component system OmpR family response regulator